MCKFQKNGCWIFSIFFGISHWKRNIKKTRKNVSVENGWDPSVFRWNQGNEKTELDHRVLNTTQISPLSSDIYLHACIQCSHIFKPSRQALPLQATPINSHCALNVVILEHLFTISLFGSSCDKRKPPGSCRTKVMWQLLATPRWLHMQRLAHCLQEVRRQVTRAAGSIT